MPSIPRPTESRTRPDGSGAPPFNISVHVPGTPLLSFQPPPGALLVLPPLAWRESASGSPLPPPINVGLTM
jgi:hypothetical protein